MRTSKAASVTNRTDEIETTKTLNRHWRTTLSALLLSASFSITALAAVEVGAPAPDFSLPDSNGEAHSLSQYQGKTVILEWTNDGCPYVQKHYNSGNMQALQKDMTDEGVVWLSIISSKPGSQGHVDGGKANQLTAERDAHPSAVLLDPAGDVGRLYGAKTTPHMYIINETGELMYMGAIDDQPSARPSSLEGANNYVRVAVAEMDAGKNVTTKQTSPYGCSVKY